MKTTFSPFELQSYPLNNFGGDYKDGNAVLEYLRVIAGSINVLASYSILPRSLFCRQITIGTSPVKIIEGVDLRPRILLSPPRRALTGVVSEGTLLASQSSTSGNTQSNPLAVGSFVIMSLFINVTVAGSAVLNVTPEAKNPISGKYTATASAIVVPASVGESYVYLGSVGITSQFAVSWTTTGTAHTFSIGYSLKDNIGGTSVGGSNTIYLGNQNVTVNNGFPFVEGEIAPYLPDANTDLYAVAESSITLYVFEL